MGINWLGKSNKNVWVWHTQISGLVLLFEALLQRRESVGMLYPRFMPGSVEWELVEE
jgi:hypothetical protein